MEDHRLNELLQLKAHIEEQISLVEHNFQKLKVLHKRLHKTKALIQIITEINYINQYISELHLLNDKLMEEQEKKQSQDRLSLLEEQFLHISTENDLYPDNAIIEIRPGTGGEEASIFANDLLKMYLKYTEGKGWKTDILNISKGEKGIKLVTVLIKGEKVYSKLLLEAGVHRVQRIPETEANGRIHTSTATVAILPEAEEVDVTINDRDLKIEFFRSSGAGGQHVNKTESAVRITHVPTGIVISCQDERSQHENKARAMKILRAKLYEYTIERARTERDSARKELIGTGDRSEKIKTYNYPQNRITDHRFFLTYYQLDQAMEGNIEDILEQTRIEFNKKQLKI